MSKKSTPLKTRDKFGSTLGVLAATAGSAVGLGNIWKFPYEAGANGGAAFMFVYIGFIVLIGVPLLLAEFLIGRRSQANPFGAFKRLSTNRAWRIVGIGGVATAFMILAFYGTVAGWSFEYLLHALQNRFVDRTPDENAAAFAAFIAHPWRPLLWQLVFMALTTAVVLGGVKKGIEKTSKILMPMLILLIFIMIGRSVTLPGASEGLKFLFFPDFSKLTANSVLSALGHSFFTLSLGMGTLITYGSYIAPQVSLPKMAINVAIADTAIAVLAGVAIFPAVFAFGVDPAAGPGLVFVTLPNVFRQMEFGQVFAVLFFVLLSVAALTSAISLLEVVVAYFVEELGMKRKLSAVVGAGIIACIGVFATYSFGPLKDVTVGESTIFDMLDFTSSRIMLPLGGLLISIFVGWVLHAAAVKDEITNQGSLKAPLLNAFFFIVKFIAPIAIAFVFVHGLLH